MFFACASPLAAQVGSPKAMDTDRPDFTEGTGTIARGHLQLEAGYSFQRSRGVGAGHMHSLPEALLRVGVSSRVELRFAGNYLSERGDGPSATSIGGFDDLSLGAKVSLTDARGAMPALSIMLETTLPTGSDAISANRWLPGVAALFSWETDGPWSVGAELLVSRTARDNAEGIGSVSLAYQATPKLRFYSEYIGTHALGSNSSGTGAHVINGGAMLLLNRNLQVDARIGSGLNDIAGGSLFGFGFAVRR